MKKIFLFIIVTVCLFLFFSYKLTQIPDGSNGDEASFGYNATLLSRNLRDENGRHLPIFILERGGVDYLQPIPTYFMTLMVKIFGSSLYTIRLSSVITIVVSVLLIYFLGRETLGTLGGIVSAIVLATTPIILIQSHLAFDNITPIPFVIGWLLTLYFYTKTKNRLCLVGSGILLGISYYTFKSMRIFVPMWTVLSVIYLAHEFLTKISKKNFWKIVIPVGVFTLSILPFYVVIPWLEFQYAGAVLNRTDPAISNLYIFINNYIANFDPSFLFIKGDELLIHSTGVHGMYLLASVPFFIIGLTKAWSKNNFWKLIIVAFFLGPLLFGYIGQVHRANRLLPEIPLYSLIASVGFIQLWQNKSKIVLVCLSALFILNYFDFAHYYFGNYAQDTKNLYICYSCQEQAYKILKNESVKRSLKPYVDKVNLAGVDSIRDFITTIYFIKPPASWNGDTKTLPDGAILMTDNSNINYLNQINHFDKFYFYVNR